ncbi:membrane protein insertion efficiency factor YidD [Corallococcus macrosporus]|uniref:membrane protein insertion efficiency factor YidD n=1 Tax=Corallococcus macrosporus TaxID=35 RepID=UPI0009E38504|nr:membrane protein insertion efficiency factor YidD [Corallococcus macrosporus]
MSSVPPWEGNAYSALALHPPRARQSGEALAVEASRFPWWLNPLAWLAVGLILVYRRAVPAAWKRQCIYTPTCSRYGLRAIQKYGLFRGALRTWGRIRRCNGVLYLGGQDAP